MLIDIIFILGLTIFTEVLVKVIFWFIIISLILFPFSPLFPDYDEVREQIKKKKKREQAQLKDIEKIYKTCSDDFLNINNSDESHFRYYETRKRNNFQKPD